MSVVKMLEEEAMNQLESVNQLGYGSEEHHRGIQDVSIVIDKLNETKRIEYERQDKQASREQEKEMKLKQMREERIERIIKYGVAIVTFGVSVGVHIWAHKDSQLFEKDGFMQTTEAGRASTRKILGLLDKFK